MKTITIREFRNNLPKMVDWVAAGEEIKVTRRGMEVGRFVPPEPVQPWTPPSYEMLMAQSQKIWENEEQTPLSEEEFQKMMDYIRAEREF